MNAKEIQRERQCLRSNLELIKSTLSFDEFKAMCELINITTRTWYYRMEEPDKRFSCFDLRAISRFCKVDFVQLVDGELKIR